MEGVRSSSKKSWGEHKARRVHHRHGDTLPAPKVDAIECWLPSDNPPLDDLQRGDAACQDDLLTNLKDLLQQHRSELEGRLDSLSERLEDTLLGTKTQDMLRQVLEESLLKQNECIPLHGAWTSSREFHQNLLLNGEDQASGTGLADLFSQKRDKEVDARVSASFDYSEKQKRRTIRSLAQVAKSKFTIPTPDLGNTLQGSCREVVRQMLDSVVCETLVSVLIVSNVCFLGFEVQSLRGIREEDIPMGFKAAELVYTTCFAGELFLRLTANGLSEFFAGSGLFWNIVDFLLVATSLLELVMDVLFEVSANLGYLRVIRMARTVRILRVVRIVTFFRPLRILVYSVMHTVRSLAWVIVLLLIIIYVFGVTFTLASSQSQTLMEIPDEEKIAIDDNFGSLWTSMLTLFKAITGGIDWGAAADTLNSIDPLWAYLFVAFIAFCNLSILNVVTGVVCQTAIESAREDQEIVVNTQMSIRSRYIDQLKALFAKVDVDNNELITLDEFEDKLEEKEMKEFFDAFELSVDEAWQLFKLLDTRNQGAVGTDDFIKGCLKLRGTARSIDMHMLMYQSKWTMDKLANLFAQVDHITEQVKGLRPAWRRPHESEECTSSRAGLKR